MVRAYRPSLPPAKKPTHKNEIPPKSNRNSYIRAFVNLLVQERHIEPPPKCLRRSLISRSSLRSAVGTTLRPRGSRRARRPTTSSSRSDARSTSTPWCLRTTTRPRSLSRAFPPPFSSPTSPRRPRSLLKEDGLKRVGFWV